VVNAEVVAALEKALERAKSGNMHDVVLAWVDSQDVATYQAVTSGGFEIVGALECAKAAIVHDVVVDDD
jgi:hypothetical protein